MIVYSRWMWNFFRLENEHLNNCGQFRAIKDIPLPFHIRVEGETESGSDSDNHGENGKEKESEGQGKTGRTGEDDMEVIAEGSGSDPTASHPHPEHGTSIHEDGAPGPHDVGPQPGTTGARRQSLWKRRPSEMVGESPSGAFLDNAMAEAGFGDAQRQVLASASKFFDRRDFDSKVEDDMDGLFKSRARSNTGGLSIVTGLFDPQDRGGIPSGTAWSKSPKKGVFDWSRESDDDEESDDDDMV